MKRFTSTSTFSFILLFFWSFVASAQNDGPFCLTEDSVNVEQPCPTELPDSYQDPTGRWHYNLKWWSLESLKTIGWYPYLQSGDPTGDCIAYEQYCDRTLGGYTINPDDITQAVIYTPWSIDRLRNQKVTEFESSLTQYTANEVAVEPQRTSENANNEAKWLTDWQITISETDVWTDVAGFDSSRPQILPLSNDFVAQSYVNQGLRLKQQNSAAVDASLPPLWDSVELDAFIAANSVAASDTSGATTPTHPGYEIRQGLSTNSEGFSRVVFRRIPTGNANPSLDTNYEIILVNRQPNDTRPLYVFSWTGLNAHQGGATYLNWRLLELQADNTWRATGHSSEWQYAKGDMSYIMSYGTNFQVTTDYFTNPINYADDEVRKTIGVAWDKQ